MRQKKVGTIGVVIPSYMPGLTILHVIKTINIGLRKYFANFDFNIVIVDSSDPKTQESIRKIAHDLGDNIVPYFSHKRITKGKAILIGLDILKSKKPDALLFMDAEIKSVRPNWIYKFLKPIISKKVDFVGPFYTRDKYDSLITNHIVYPFVNVMLGADLRQPIGGDFAFSGELMNFYSRRKCFSDEVNGFGIDIWLTSNAILNGFKIGQVCLGTKDHAKTIKDPKFPEKSLGIMFTEVIKTLFDVLTCYNSVLQNQLLVRVNTFGKPLNLIPRPVRADFHNLWQTSKRLYPVYRDQIKNTYPHITEVDNILKREKGNTDFSVYLWVKILFTYLSKYHRLTSENKKRALINSLLPLYFARIACFVYESRNMEVPATENNIQNSLKIFEEGKMAYFKRLRLGQNTERKNRSTH